jgi:hypothetical protein
MKSESRQQHKTEEEKGGKFNETAHPLNIYREPATIELLRRLKKKEERRKKWSVRRVDTDHHLHSFRTVDDV